MRILLTFATLALGAVVMAQPAKKPASPPASTTATIGGHAVSIKYSAPSVRGRKIFGGLVPYGQIWRAGANEATALHTDGDLTIGTLNVPKGDYTLYIWPEASGMTLAINKQTGQWGTDYDQKQDLGRVPLKVSKTPALVEVYKMTLTGSGKTGKLELEWENTAASVEIKAK